MGTMPDEDADEIDYVKLYFDLKNNEQKSIRSQATEEYLSELRKAYKKSRSKRPKYPQQSIDDIIYQAKIKLQLYNWFDIDHLTDDDFFYVSEQLNLEEFKRWYEYHKKINGFVFSKPVYIRFEHINSGFIWFTDAEYQARLEAGKSVRHVRPHDIITESVFEIFNRRDIGLGDKIDDFEKLFPAYNKDQLLNIKVEFYLRIYDCISIDRNVTEEEKKFLRNQKTAQTKLINKGSIEHDKINFMTLNILLNQYDIKLIHYRS